MSKFKGLDEMSELKSLLEKTSDSYEDYVIGVLCQARHSIEIENKIIKFLKENPTANSSQVLDYASDFLFDENGVLLPEFVCKD
ncbi:MAG: hypothetical protein K2K44_05670 [Oscillospiraceae bacterium]|nr:hypothetical protein [Oscillospiraceae bacterium]